MSLNVLVLSASASAINYKNSLLKEPNIHLFFTDVNPFATCFYEEGVTGLIVPRSKNFEAYQAALDEIIDKHNIDILLPTSDHDMQGIAALLKRGWNPAVKMFDFDPDQINLFVDKQRVMDKLLELEMPVPVNYKHSESFSFPVVVKPTNEGGSKGVSIVQSSEELDKAIHEIEQVYGGNYVVQQFIPGGTGSIYVALLLYGNDGEVYGEALSNSSLTFMTWGGGGNAGNLVHDQQVIELAKEIVAKLGGWKGPINLEFKRDEITGKFYLMEINCRLNGYSYFTTMNRMNFPKAVVELLANGTTDFLRMPPPDECVNFVMGVREKVVESWHSPIEE